MRLEHRFRTAALLAPLAFCALGTAPSFASYACAVIETPDGFVSLRTEPSARSAEIAKMKPHEFVGLLDPKTEEIVRSGDWLFVRWYPGTVRTEDHIPELDDRTAKAGWVRDTLINCFE